MSVCVWCPYVIVNSGGSANRFKFFFFSSRRRHTRLQGDWSSDVCSSDLLQSGENRSFEQNMQGMRYRRSIRSPNGEDVLYVFYEPESGRMALFKYNLIERALQPPIIGHGYARMDDGRVVIFAAESNEASRVHPMH